MTLLIACLLLMMNDAPGWAYAAAAALWLARVWCVVAFHTMQRG